MKGPASYFPSIEATYGQPIGDWQQLVRDRLPAKHGELVSMLKADHGMGHGHANAIVAHVLATTAPAPAAKLGDEKLTPGKQRRRFIKVARED